MSHQLLQIKQLFSDRQGGKHACSSLLDTEALLFGSLGMAVEHSAPFRITPEKSSKKQITKDTFWMLCHQTACECNRTGFYQFLGAIRWCSS